MTCVATAGRQVTQPPPPALGRLNPVPIHRSQSLIFPFISNTKFSAAQPELTLSHRCLLNCAQTKWGKGWEDACLRALRAGLRGESPIALKRFKCFLRNENRSTQRGWNQGHPVIVLAPDCGFFRDSIRPPLVPLCRTSAATLSRCLVCDPGRATYFVRCQFPFLEDEGTSGDCL